MSRANRSRFGLLAAFVFVFLSLARAAAADDGSTAGAAGAGAIEVAAALCLSGDEQPFGQSTLEGIQLAIDEANARGGGQRIAVKTYDERSTVEGGRQVAERIVASRAPFVLGSVFSFLSLVEGPIFAKGGMASLATATSDLITQNPTTFRALFKNSDQGELLATYINRVLGLRRVAVMSIDDGYGRTLRSGFETEAKRLALDVTYHVFKTSEEAQQAAQDIAADPTRPAVVLLMLDGEGARVLPTPRRQGVTAPILGADGFGDEDFSNRMAREPEEIRHHGSLSEGLYAVAPIILDSANAETLAFAGRYRARYGHDPSWNATAGYDLGLLAVAAVRTLGRDGDTAAQRTAALQYFQSLNSPASAVPGLLGPIWFDQDRGRIQAIRIARFAGGHLESAPLQIVPVSLPSADALTSGEVFEMSPGRYGRLQRVVYSGVFLNEISRIDLMRSSFGADFYVWLRYARNAGVGGLDPADITFPNMLSGGFNPTRPAEQAEMPDGTVYRLWRVQGEFRNDFDLHDFPFDRQSLELPFFNARGASDRIVYVIDRAPRDVGARTVGHANGVTRVSFGGLVAPAAFRNLTQWHALGAEQRRDSLVTESALGDPALVGAEGRRELSGYLLEVSLRRDTIATLTKNLLPLGVMTIIMFASLFLHHGLTVPKLVIQVTAALSGTVLLGAVNAQLGQIGYTVAVEYVLYGYFALALLCIISVVMSERLRVTGHPAAATKTDLGARILYAGGVFIIVALCVVANRD